MNGYASLSHSALLFWTQLAAVLIAARLFGWLARKVGQPDIVGALLAGVLLGPSVFGHVAPDAFHWFLPHGAGEGTPLHAVAQFALIVLLIVLGAETDLTLIRSLGRGAAWTSVASLAVPLAAGLLLAPALPRGLTGDAGSSTAFAVLLAGTICVSSLPVVARIVAELGMTRRNFGQLALASGAINDAVGFLLLALGGVLAGQGGTGDLVVPVVGLVVMVGVLATVGQRAVDALLREVRRSGPNVPGALTVILGTAFLLAAVSQALHVDAALGAFLAGIVLGRSRFQQRPALQQLEGFTTAVFAPLYFATAGLHADLSTLGASAVVTGFLLVLAVAATTKFIGSFAGAAAARLHAREGLALGLLLNGRGAMQVIIGSAGLALGVFNASVFTVIILMSLLTTLPIPPLLRAVVRGWSGTSEEQERLDREEELGSNVVVRGQRLLLPSRGSPNASAAAQVLDHAWPTESEVTVLSIDTGEGEKPTGLTTRWFTGRPVRVLEAQSDDVLAQVLAEANLGYGVIALGTVDQPSSDRLLPPVIEAILGRSPIPLLLVRRGSKDTLGDDGHPRLTFQHVVVGVSGNAASRAGTEVANSIALRNRARASHVHVLTRPGAARERRGPNVLLPRRRGRPAASATATTAANALVEEARTQAAAKSVDAPAVVLHGTSAGQAIADYVSETGADLVVVGAVVRRVGDRPFLGHTVEHLLEHVLAPAVVVVVLPEIDPAREDGASGVTVTD